MATAEQHEQVAQWLVYRGDAATLVEARDLLTRAIAKVKSKRDDVLAVRAVEARLGRPGVEVDGAEVVVEAEKILTAAGKTEWTEVEYADALVNASARIEARGESVQATAVGSTAVPTRISTPVAELERGRLLDLHAKAVLAMAGKSFETCSQAEYADALVKAGEQIPAVRS